jgi:hypothetical protein
VRIEMLIAKMIADAVVQRLPLALIAAEMTAHINSIAKGVISKPPDIRLRLN